MPDFLHWHVKGNKKDLFRVHFPYHKNPIDLTHNPFYANSYPLSIFKYRIPDSSELSLCSFLTTLSRLQHLRRADSSIKLGEAWKIVA